MTMERTKQDAAKTTAARRMIQDFFALEKDIQIDRETGAVELTSLSYDEETDFVAVAGDTYRISPQTTNRTVEGVETSYPSMLVERSSDGFETSEVISGAELDLREVFSVIKNDIEYRMNNSFQMR